jgi:hypothetical protein
MEKSINNQQNAYMPEKAIEISWKQWYTIS